MKHIAFFVTATLTIVFGFTACDNSGGDGTPILTGITVADAPTVYLKDSTFNKNGILVKAQYSDGTSTVIKDFTWTGFDSTELGDQTVIVYYQKKSASFTVTVVGQGLIEMEEVTGGQWFSMGSNEMAAEKPPHEVILTCFYIGKYEITQKEYEEVMRNNPSVSKGDNLPVTNISWYDAVEFCNKLSGEDGLEPAYIIIDKFSPDPNNTSVSDTKKWKVTLVNGADGYRLPTEAEWEYACRAGTSAPYSVPEPLGGDDITGEEANFNSLTPEEVGSYAPNALGIRGMHGNVWEWCWDWYGVYSESSAGNPKGPASGEHRVMRGGAFSSATAVELRSSYREKTEADNSGNDIGFRVLRPKYPEGIPSNN